MRRILIVLAIILMPRSLYAAPTPKPTPAVTGNFCVNQNSGAVRNVLVKNGVVQACHKNEQLVAIINFDSAPTPDPSPTKGSPAPTPTPSPGDPTPTPTATPTVGGDPSTCSGCVVDANGKEVGPLEAINAPYNEVVLEIINNVGMELEVDPDGFISQFPQQNIPMVLYYTSSDCSGQGYMALYDIGGGGQDVTPIVQINYAEGSPYVFNNIVWYANPPYQHLTLHSLQTFGDPAQASISGCQTPNPQPDFGTLLVGPPASFNLNNLGFTPPFSPQ